jgi:organic hydroperoxide reductase OsmC/OhrA
MLLCVNSAFTNPEQLFAAGWSACFIGAMRLAAGNQPISNWRDICPKKSIMFADVFLALRP